MLDEEKDVLKWIKDNLSPYIKKAIEGTEFTEDWLGAIACRETGVLIMKYVNKGYTLEKMLPLIKGDFSGGKYHGHGFWQIDDRSFPDFIKSGKWMNVQESCNQAVNILQSKAKYLKKYFDISFGNIIFERALTASYNCGEGNVAKTIRKKIDVDSYTANHDYSKDVFRLREIYKSI